MYIREDTYNPKSLTFDSSNRPKVNYYAILGLSRNAPSTKIKAAYRELVLRKHPDKNPDKSELAKAEFRKIQEAYEVLSDIEMRERYNRYLGRAVYHFSESLEENRENNYDYINAILLLPEKERLHPGDEIPLDVVRQLEKIAKGLSDRYNELEEERIKREKEMEPPEEDVSDEPWWRRPRPMGKYYYTHAIYSENDSSSPEQKTLEMQYSSLSSVISNTMNCIENPLKKRLYDLSLGYIESEEMREIQAVLLQVENIEQLASAKNKIRYFMRCAEDIFIFYKANILTPENVEKYIKYDLSEVPRIFHEQNWLNQANFDLFADYAREYPDNYGEIIFGRSEWCRFFEGLPIRDYENVLRAGKFAYGFALLLRNYNKLGILNEDLRQLVYQDKMRWDSVRILPSICDYEIEIIKRQDYRHPRFSDSSQEENQNKLGLEKRVYFGGEEEIRAYLDVPGRVRYVETKLDIDISEFTLEALNGKRKEIFAYLYKERFLEKRELTEERKRVVMWEGTEEIKSLVSSLNHMFAFGLNLLCENIDKAKVVIKLAIDLKQDLQAFTNLPAEEREKQSVQFKQEFIQKLHSQDQAMLNYYTDWEVIVKNILIALTIIGLVALGMHYRKTGHCFFVKTKRDEVVDVVEQQAQLCLSC